MKANKLIGQPIVTKQIKKGMLLKLIEVDLNAEPLGPIRYVQSLGWGRVWNGIEICKLLPMGEICELCKYRITYKGNYRHEMGLVATGWYKIICLN